MIKNNEVVHCREQEEMIDNIVIPVLNREDVIIDNKKIKEGLELQKYFPFRLLEWEVFLFALIVGVRFTNGELYFIDIRILMGRGNGKNGFLDFLGLYLISPYNGIREYNIDIIANTEDQAKTCNKDLYDLINNHPDPEKQRVLKYYFKATAEVTRCKQTNSELRFNTSSSKGKDSKRTGMVVVDETHEYTLSDLGRVNTLKSGLGKVADARVLEITTDGKIRDGYLDREKLKYKDILRQYNPENRTLIFWCRQEAEEEWNNMELLTKANPSLPHLPTLQTIIRNEIMNMPYNMEYYYEFLAKRCNYPVGNSETDVASKEDILATTSQSVPDLEGLSCVGGIDYAKTNDFVACGLLFRTGGKTIWIHHTFICAKSRDLPGIKAPLRRNPLMGPNEKSYEELGEVEFINDVEVPPEKVAKWFEKQSAHYNIIKIALDNFRYTWMNKALKEIGFDAYENKNVVLTHKWDVIRIAPVINSLFVTHNLIFTETIMRWYTNNTKKVTINGNVTFAKIDENLRKTDGYMAFVAAMTIEEEIPEESDIDFDLPMLAI